MQQRTKWGFGARKYKPHWKQIITHQHAKLCLSFWQRFASIFSSQTHQEPNFLGSLEQNNAPYFSFPRLASCIKPKGKGKEGKDQRWERMQSEKERNYTMGR